MHNLKIIFAFLVTMWKLFSMICCLFSISQLFLQFFSKFILTGYINTVRERKWDNMYQMKNPKCWFFGLNMKFSICGDYIKLFSKIYSRKGGKKIWRFAAFLNYTERLWIFRAKKFRAFQNSLENRKTSNFLSRLAGIEILEKKLYSLYTC